MKICFFNTKLFGANGISRVLSCLASELAKDNDVTVVTFENPNEVNRDMYKLSDKVNVVFWKPIYGKCYIRRAAHKINQQTDIVRKINSPALYNWIYLPRHMQNIWAEFINENDFDVVVGVQAKGAYILGSIADRIKAKTVGWQHNSYAAYIETKGDYYWNQDYLFDTYLPKLDAYVVLNEYDEQQYLEKKNIKATTIYNPKSFVSQKKAELNRKRFIAVGALRKAKGFDMLIDAFRIFTQNTHGWELDIFGEGEDYDSLQSMICNSGLEGQITLRGVSETIDAEMLDSSALLLSSRWEGMPMVVLEALEVGLPVVAFDITAMIPLVDDGKEGIIVPQFDVNAYAQAMEKIADNISLRKNMGKAASKKAECFSVEVIKNKWVNLFESL
ncbi:MAG: glycosyltransferase [Oscillospiraceae bacterium]|nr:glycosyltransferase [Oscillospiraceae bacterium]